MIKDRDIEGQKKESPSQSLGIVVISLCGNDKGKRFLVIAEEDDFYFLCDGKKRTIEKPKKKRKRHVEKIGFCPLFLEIAGEEIRRDRKERNRSVEKILKLAMDESEKGGFHGKRRSY